MDPGSSRSDQRWLYLTGIVVGGGILARLNMILERRSLWQDEAMMSLNVLTRPLGELLSGPLEFHQTASPLFLLWEWGMVRLFGVSELTLRFPSLVAGVLLLGAAWWCAREVLDGAASGAVMVALVAASPHLVGYSAEVKPYMFGALWGLLSVGVAVRWIRMPNSRRLPAAFLGLGLGGILLAVTAPFVLAGTWLGLLADGRIRRSREGRLWLACMPLAWLTLFIPIYLRVYHPVASDPYMLEFWHGAFLRGSPREMFLLHRNWIVGSLFGSDFVPPKFGLVVTVLAVAGLVHLARKRGVAVAGVVAGPLALAYAASAAGQFPLEARVLLFGAPLVALLLGAGIQGLTAVRGTRWSEYAALALGVALLVPASLTLARGRVRADFREELRPLLEADAFRSRELEPAYVFGKATPSWIFYTTDWDRPKRQQVEALKAAALTLGPNSGNAPSRGREVAREGWDLVLETGPRITLIGIPSGFQGLFRQRWDYDVHIDAGWAANEAARILDRSPACFWTVFTHHKPLELRSLDAAVRGHGADLEYEGVAPGAAVRRYCRTVT